MTKELDWSRWLGPEAAPTLAEQMALVLRLSVPAILAEVSSTAMNYIDSGEIFLRKPHPLHLEGPAPEVVEEPGVRGEVEAEIAAVQGLPGLPVAAMNYIDSAMVGSLGANATAAIGLVASTTWLFGGLCIAMVTGFSVQIAHLIGGGRRAEAQSVVRQGIWRTIKSIFWIFHRRSYKGISI